MNVLREDGEEWPRLFLVVLVAITDLHASASGQAIGDTRPTSRA